MPTPGERLAVLLEAHGDSTRTAAELCGLDHTTIIRVRQGETENPATLAKIAEGYGVPLTWLQGQQHLATDFVYAVLTRPIKDRVLLLCEPQRRLTYAIRFLVDYDPGVFTPEHVARLLGLLPSEVEAMLAGGLAPVNAQKARDFCAAAGLPEAWMACGLVGGEDEEVLLQGLAEHALRTLAEVLGAKLDDERLRSAAVALV